MLLVVKDGLRNLQLVSALSHKIGLTWTTSKSESLVTSAVIVLHVVLSLQFLAIVGTVEESLLSSDLCNKILL